AADGDADADADADCGGGFVLLGPAARKQFKRPRTAEPSEPKHPRSVATPVRAGHWNDEPVQDRQCRLQKGHQELSQGGEPDGEGDAQQREMMPMRTPRTTPQAADMAPAVRPDLLGLAAAATFVTAGVAPTAAAADPAPCWQGPSTSDLSGGGGQLLVCSAAELYRRGLA
ncbi:unnamed protein product, partial [Polarella glacialis]